MAGSPVLVIRAGSTDAEGILTDKAAIDREISEIGTKPEHIYGIPGQRITHHLEALTELGRILGALDHLAPVLGAQTTPVVHNLPSGPSFYDKTSLGHGHPLGAYGSRDLGRGSGSERVASVPSTPSVRVVADDGYATPRLVRAVRQPSVGNHTPLRLDRLASRLDDETPPDREKPRAVAATVHDDLDMRAKILTSTQSGQFLAKHQDCLTVNADAVAPNLATLLSQAALKLMAANNEEQEDRLTYHIPPHAAEMLIDCTRKLVEKSKDWPDFNPETNAGFTAEQKKTLILLGAICAVFHDAFFRGKRGIDEMTCADIVVRMLGLDEALADKTKDQERRDLIRLIQIILVGGTLPVFGNTDTKPTMLAAISSPYVTMPESALRSPELNAVLDVAKTLAEMDVHRTESPEMFSDTRIVRLDAATPQFGDMKDELDLWAIESLSEAGFETARTPRMAGFMQALFAKVGQALRTNVEMNSGLVADAEPKKPSEPVKPKMPPAPHLSAFESELPGAVPDTEAQTKWQNECQALQAGYDVQYAQYLQDLSRYEKEIIAFREKVQAAKIHCKAYMNTGANIVATGALPASFELGVVPVTLFEGFSGDGSARDFSESAFARRFGNTYLHEKPEVRKALWEAEAVFLSKLKDLKGTPYAEKLMRYLLLNAGAQDGAYFAPKILDARFDLERVVDGMLSHPDNTWTTDQVLQIGLGEFVVPAKPVVAREGAVAPSPASTPVVDPAAGALLPNPTTAPNPAPARMPTSVSPDEALPLHPTGAAADSEDASSHKGFGGTLPATAQKYAAGTGGVAAVDTTGCAPFLRLFCCGGGSQSVASSQSVPRVEDSVSGAGTLRPRADAAGSVPA